MGDTNTASMQREPRVDSRRRAWTACWMGLAILGFPGLAGAPSMKYEVTPQNLDEQVYPIQITHQITGDWVQIQILAGIEDNPYYPLTGLLSVTDLVSAYVTWTPQDGYQQFWVELHRGAVGSATFDLLAGRESMPGYDVWSISLDDFVDGGGR